MVGQVAFDSLRSTLWRLNGSLNCRHQRVVVTFVELWVSKQRSVAPFLVSASATFEMPLPLTVLFDLPPPLHPPSSAPRKPIRTSKPHTLPRPHRSAGGPPKHARPKSARRHFHKPASPQLARKRCHLRRQTRWERAVSSRERSRSCSEIAWIKSERRDGSRCWNRSEAACSAGARGRSHIAWRSRCVRH